MNCLLRPDLCDEIRQRIKGEAGITPMVPTNSSDGSYNESAPWTPPTSQLISGSKDGDPTSHVITALLLFLILAYIAYFLGKKKSVTQNKWNKLKKTWKRTPSESKSHLHIAVRHLHRRLANRGFRRRFLEFLCRCRPQHADSPQVELLWIRPLAEISLEIENDLIQIWSYITIYIFILVYSNLFQFIPVYSNLFQFMSS